MKSAVIFPVFISFLIFFVLILGTVNVIGSESLTGNIPEETVMMLSEVKVSEEQNLIVGSSDEAFYFSVVQPAASKVLVKLSIYFNSSAADENGYTTASVYTAGGQFVDDAFPVNKWCNITYQTKVLMVNENFCVEFRVKGAEGAAVKVKDISVSDNVPSGTLLGGTKLYMLPSTISAQSMSFVIYTMKGG